MPKLSPIEIEANNHQKLLNKDFADLCRLPDSDGAILSKIEMLLNSGAEINCFNSKPLYNATRSLNFKLIYLLIKYGALNSPLAVNYIASICDYRNFKKNEEAFFELIDHCISIKGFDMAYFVPYINTMFLHGQAQKTNLLITKYNISASDIVNCVYERVIFEIINNGYENTLSYIERYRNWITQSCFDTAVSSGDIKALKYILAKNLGFEPSQSALLKVIYDGNTEVLEVLKLWGFGLKKDLVYLKQACRAFYSKGKTSLEYLLKNGFSLQDTYDGKSIYQNAVADNNTPLINYLQRFGINN